MTDHRYDHRTLRPHASLATNVPPPGYLSSAELLRRVDHRLTYRQLDYSIRTGKIMPSVDAGGSGSGGARGWSEEDVAALLRVLDDLDIAQTIAAEFDSGALWRKHWSRPKHVSRR